MSRSGVSEKTSLEVVQLAVETESAAANITKRGPELSLPELQEELLKHANIIHKQQNLLERCVLLIENLSETLEKMSAPPVERQPIGFQPPIRK